MVEMIALSSVLRSHRDQLGEAGSHRNQLGDAGRSPTLPCDDEWFCKLLVMADFPESAQNIKRVMEIYKSIVCMCSVELF